MNMKIWMNKQRHTTVPLESCWLMNISHSLSEILKTIQLMLIILNFSDDFRGQVLELSHGWIRKARDLWISKIVKRKLTGLKWKIHICKSILWAVDPNIASLTRKWDSMHWDVPKQNAITLLVQHRAWIHWLWVKSKRSFKEQETHFQAQVPIQI